MSDGQHTHHTDAASHPARDHGFAGHGSHGSHGSHGDPEHDVAAMLTPEYWDERYGSADAIWSGNPNPQLVAQVSDLAPGTALDVGSGEGADAIWLAQRGWKVTGLDISAVALDRAAQRAAAAGDDVAERITWELADVVTWRPTAQFDLVSAQFMHLPQDALRSVHQTLAGAVRPGGTLLIVGHDLSDLETTMGRPRLPDMFFTADDVGATLDPAEWRIVVAERPAREAKDPDGRLITIRDAVLRAVRQPTG